MRFDTLAQTVRDLLAQSAAIDAVHVVIPRRYKRCPEGSFSLPTLPKGATVLRCETDLGPATKVLPVIAQQDDPNRPILYCEDDRRVHRHWAQNLLDAARTQPEVAIANADWDLPQIGVRPLRDARPKRARRLRSAMDPVYRMRRLRQQLAPRPRQTPLSKPARWLSFSRTGPIDIMKGYGGVPVRARFFPAGSSDIPPVAFHLDGIWLSGMMARSGTMIMANNGYVPEERQDQA